MTKISREIVARRRKILSICKKMKMRRITWNSRKTKNTKRKKKKRKIMKKFWRE